MINQNHLAHFRGVVCAIFLIFIGGSLNNLLAVVFHESKIDVEVPQIVQEAFESVTGCVVSLENNQPICRATGVLISPNKFLTVAHPLMESGEVDPKRWYFVYGKDWAQQEAINVSAVEIISPDQRFSMAAFRRVRNGLIRGCAWQANHLDSEALFSDFAILELAQNVVKKDSLLTISGSLPTEGDLVFFGGYGSMGTGNAGMTDETTSWNIGSGRVEEYYSRGCLVSFSKDAPTSKEACPVTWDRGGPVLTYDAKAKKVFLSGIVGPTVISPAFEVSHSGPRANRGQYGEKWLMLKGPNLGDEKDAHAPVD